MLILYLTLNSGQLRRECNCGLFMTNKNHEVELKRLKPINLNECSEFDVCMTECAKEVCKCCKFYQSYKLLLSRFRREAELNTKPFKCQKINWIYTDYSSNMRV